jgi:hypothetical protein
MNKDKTIANQAKRKKEVHAFGMLKANEKTIKNQADVIKDMWSELQQLKRILIDDHPEAWKQIQKQINK